MSHTGGPAQSGPRDVQIAEAHDSTDPPREDHIDGGDDHGRRRYDLQPEPRGRTDFMGLNSTWWMALGWLVLLIVVAFPFPWWW
jgi:hypothetical protein